jgi:ketosteroid isomerase-like protein
MSTLAGSAKPTGGRGTRAAPPGARGACLALAVSLAVGTSCRSSPSAPGATFRSDIARANDELEALFRSGNLLGVADAYADHATIVDEDGGRTVGREEIDARWAAIESPIDWDLSIRSVRGTDAVAYEIGTSRMTTKQAGALQTEVREFLIVWRRGPDGLWRIEMDASWPKKRR